MVGCCVTFVERQGREWGTGLRTTFVGQSGMIKNTFFWTDNWVGGVPLRTKFHRLFDLAVHRECLVADMAVLGCEEGRGGWVWRRGLLAWEKKCVRECSVLLHNVVLQDHVNDSGSGCRICVIGCLNHLWVNIIFHFNL